MRLVEVVKLGSYVVGRVAAVSSSAAVRARSICPTLRRVSPVGAEPAFDPATRDGRAMTTKHVGDEQMTAHAPGPGEAVDQGLGVVYAA